VDGNRDHDGPESTVAVRKAEFERFRQMPASADRFETHGVVNQGHDYGAPQAEEMTGDRKQGLGCCPGVVRGRCASSPTRATRS